MALGGKNWLGLVIGNFQAKLKADVMLTAMGYKFIVNYCVK